MKPRIFLLNLLSCGVSQSKVTEPLSMRKIRKRSNSEPKGIGYSLYLGLGYFPRTFTPGISPTDKNANNVVEIEAGMIKQYFSSQSWIDETIRCIVSSFILKHGRQDAPIYNKHMQYIYAKS